METDKKTDRKTNFLMFQTSKLSQFQQDYPCINFNQPVELDQLVKDEPYLMVFITYCWDDICYNDHECSLDFNITNRVVFNGIQKDYYEFLHDTDDNKTFFRIYDSEFNKGDYASNFFYSLNNTHFIK